MTGLTNTYIQKIENPWQQGLLSNFKTKGYPSKKNESYKFTPINTWYEKTWKPQSKQTIDQPFLKKVDSNFAMSFINEFDKDDDPLLDLHLSQVKDFFHFEVSEDINYEINIDNLKEEFSNSCLLIDLSTNCNILERLSTNSSSFSQTSVFIKAKCENAQYTTIQEIPEDSYNQSWYFVKTFKNTKNFSLLQYNQSTGSNRLNPFFVVNNEDTTVESHCFYKSSGSTKQDIFSEIKHLAPNSYSDQTVKGILRDNARNAFTGKIFIQEHCAGVDANQFNKNLVFGNKAHALSQPQLEIYNFDVKCAHGSTTGQINDNEIFYFMARGISKKRATELLLNSYTDEFVSKVRSKEIKEKLITYIGSAS